MEKGTKTGKEDGSDQKVCNGRPNNDQHSHLFCSVIKSLFDCLVSIGDFIHFILSSLRCSGITNYLAEKFIPSFSADDILFDNEDTESFFSGNRNGDKFIGKYTIETMEKLISGSRFGQKIREIVPDWYIEYDLSDCFSHYAYIRSRSITEKDKFYVFIIIQVDPFAINFNESQGVGSAYINNNMPSNPELLNIRWFSLQNPTLKFLPNRPRLPGQRFPGTGLGHEALYLLIKMAKNSKRDGIVNKPEHFHNAYLYENFMFLNPTDQGRFMRIVKDLSQDLKNRGLSAVSWAIYLGFLHEGGNAFSWDLQEQVFPLSLRMRFYFHKFSYKKEVNRAFNAAGPFQIKWEEAEKIGIFINS